MRLLSLLLAVILAGCASKKPDQLDPATANTRALEQVRMRAVTSGDANSARGAEVVVADPNKVFDPASARFGGARSLGGKSASTTEFHFIDHTRTKGFGGTKDFNTKGAWMGDAKFATKSAPTKASWFGGRSARVKSYDTKEARDASKSAATRALPEGDRKYAAQGRKQAQLDANGRDTLPFGTHDMGPSWSGELKPLTIEDVKGLLNKN
jgi:hypothetical protein